MHYNSIYCKLTIIMGYRVVSITKHPTLQTNKLYLRVTALQQHNMTPFHISTTHYLRNQITANQWHFHESSQITLTRWPKQTNSPPITPDAKRIPISPMKDHKAPQYWSWSEPTLVKAPKGFHFLFSCFCFQRNAKKSKILLLHNLESKLSKTGCND